MNDNDVDDLARVLAEHRLRWIDASGVSSPCVCGATLAASSFQQHVAAAVLASGVVVSARDVKQRADELSRLAAGYREDEYQDGKRDAYAVAAYGLRSLLREPATDAARQVRITKSPRLTAGYRSERLSVGDVVTVVDTDADGDLVVEKAGIDDYLSVSPACVEPATDAAPTGEGVRLARCTNVSESDGIWCPGVLAFRPGDLEATCDTCGARCGSLVANYTTVASLPEGGGQRG